jgi:hypothetical protein
MSDLKPMHGRLNAVMQGALTCEHIITAGENRTRNRLRHHSDPHGRLHMFGSFSRTTFDGSTSSVSENRETWSPIGAADGAWFVQEP